MRSIRSRDWRQPIVAIAGLVVALFVLAGGISVASGSQSRKSGVESQLTWGLSGSIRSLDYTHSGDPISSSVIFLGMEPLVQYNKAGGIEPDLASSFSIPNPTTYVYNLRRGVKFWDGHPLTSADVIYSLKQSALKTSEIGSFFNGVKSIRATKRMQVTIKLKSPNPFFRYTMAVTPIGEKAFWSSHIKTVGTPDVMNMGTGPFEFSSFNPATGVTLTRNPNYWGRKASFKTLKIDFISDPNTMLLAMRSGEIQGTFKVPFPQIAQYKQLPGVNVQTASAETPGYLSLDVSDPPFSDIHVRRAIAYAVNQAGMVHAVLNGYGSPAPTMPPPQQWGDVMSPSKVAAFYKTIPKYPFSIAKAKAELAKSSVPHGFTANITYPNSSPELGEALQILAQDLKQIGITLNIKEIPHSQWVNVFYVHHNPLGPQVGEWTPDYPDPADALSLQYPSANAAPNSFNIANYKSKQMDALIARQNNSVNPAVRAAAIKKALKLAAVDLPYIPLFYEDFAMGLNSKFQYNQLGPWYVYQHWADYISAK